MRASLCSTSLKIQAKSLVFSQYSSTLEWLQEELPKRGFQFRTLKGNMSMAARAKALHDFQADPPTTIFLLSMR
jgi:SNF2 family DNA or RNA helicase